MSGIRTERLTAEVDGEFVVFLIGVRVNRLVHRPAWAAFNRAIGSNGDVGIWHETFRVRPSDDECVYKSMPPFGLAKATRAVPATGRRDFAPGRMAAP